MAIISRITTQKRNKHRYNIYIDNGQGETFGFGIDEDVLIKYRLKKGMKLEQSIYEQIRNDETFHQSYSMAIRFLSYRMRTKKELEIHLLNKDVDEVQIPRIIEKLYKENLLNDEAFSDSFVRNRINMSDKGPLVVKQELIAKGISSEIAAKAIEQFTYELQYEKAINWAQKKLNQKKKNALQKRLQSIKASLAQKGFSEEVIQDALQNINISDEKNDEWDAVIHHGNKMIQRYGKRFSNYELKNKVKTGLYRQGFSIKMINRFFEANENNFTTVREDADDDSL
ncbi:recombination regulator RecX [Virgibacillus sp. W0430]|uniref:recombination regulator RecX n=1 Tax=Virgibacillus sp. W0430 TaxID=3391580 RepID=UPI003F45823B